MTDYVRRLVSGNKARFKDKELDVELDLVYLTDQVIIMGYPASGVEGLYRNRREDVKKFLDHRHGKNYWIFNFCPIKENSYDAQYFEGRVSRFPFPDHHAPPLAIMPLVAREMRIWLDGSSKRVAVLHCKAGKGRSGTMACTYLLSLDPSIPGPNTGGSQNAADWAVNRAKEAMAAVPPDEETATEPITSTEQSSDTLVESPVQEPVAEGSHHKSLKTSLNDILDLHTSRRMRQPSSPDKKVKQGVSIPSQRRWLYYWSLLLSKQAPSHLWSTEPRVPSSSLAALSSVPPEERRNTPKVRLTEIKLRMKESSGMTMNLVRAANALFDRGKGGGQVWVSLARYDDAFVQLLERWERYTRDEGHLGRRKPGTGHFGDESLTELFKDHKWDGEKMVRSFARLGCLDDKAISKTEEDKEKIITYTLNPLSDKRWKNLQEEIEKAKNGETVFNPEEHNIPASETNSMYDLTQSVKDRGVVLDAAREVRVKLYMGQIFMGWLWFIPTFHMPQPPPTNGQPLGPTKLKLTRKELDFPLGIGSSIVDVEISLEWLTRADTEQVQPPAVATPAEEKDEDKTEPMGLAAAAQAVATSGQGVGSVVEAKQAGED